MLNDYIVSVQLPINDAASGSATPGYIAGSTFGYNEHEVPGEPAWYWDGQDIWLPSANATIFAAFKGTVQFVANGEQWPIDLESLSPGDAPFPAVGDSLLLQLWPQDYIKLQELLPDGAPVPKYIIYQNIEQSTAIDSALSLITDHAEYRDHYKKIFMTEEDGDDISDAVFSARASRWINEVWLQGEGIGILVNPGDILGEAATVPAADDFPDEVRVQHYIPAEADESSWKRLTLKILTSAYLSYDIAFLFYLFGNIENEQLAYLWPDDSPYINNCSDQVRTGFKIRAKLITQTDEDFEREPDPDPPAALPEIVLRIQQTGQSRKVLVLYDPFEEPDIGYWRVQSRLTEGSYSAEHMPLPFIAQYVDPQIFDLTESDGSLTFLTPGDFYYRIRLRHWLPFDTPAGTRRRFVLGINMETCRRQFYRDLSGNDMLYAYRPVAGTIYQEVYNNYTESNAWLNSSANEAKVREDLRNIKSTGASAIRFWVFEYFEGLRFTFTEDGSSSTGIGSALAEERMNADRNANPNLHCRVIPGGTVHVCTQEEFRNMVEGWVSRGLQFRVSPSTNPLFQRLIENARKIQVIAEEENIKILWTLWTQYGETKPDVPTKGSLIYFSDNRVVTGPPPERQVDAHGNLILDPWIDFYNSPRQPDPPTGAARRDGRLPIEAWIYKACMSTPIVRDSYINNAVIPFVESMEQTGGTSTLGYDIMNEPDIVWDGCAHAWTQDIGGQNISRHFIITRRGNDLVWDDRRRTSYAGGFYWDSWHELVADSRDPTQLPTYWKMDILTIRTFLSECRAAISDVLVRIHGAYHLKLIIAGVLGSTDDVTFNEMELIQRSYSGTPDLTLSCSGMTRYTEARWWDTAFTLGTTDADGNIRGIHPVHITPWLQTQNNICLFTEANDYSDPRSRDTQREAVRSLLWAALMNAYAGVFIWNYHDPERPRDNDGNALTEHSGSTEGFEFRTGSTVRARPAVQEIIDFERRFRRLIL